MKTLNTFLLLASISFTSLANSSPEKIANSNPTILVVGFEKNNLVSNYYGNDYLSRQFGISEDSLHLFYFTSIFDKLKSINPLIYHDNDNHQSLSQFYNLFNVNTAAQNSESANLIISNLLEHNNSDYLLYINQYQINWSGEPFNTIVHLMEYSLLDRNKKEVLNGQIFFNSESLTPIFSQKRAERRLKQLSQKIEKAIK